MSYKEKIISLLNDKELSQEELEHVYSELKEMKTEDDKIRKEIIEYLKYKYESPNAINRDYDKWIAWLEKQGAEWADRTAWKPADVDELPEIDREVITIVKENDHYKVVFAHRPSEYWDGRNILTNEVTRNYTERYDKGEWNQPNVKWWLDLELPKMEMEKL